MPYIGKHTQVTYTPDTKNIEKVTFKKTDITNSLVRAAAEYTQSRHQSKNASSPSSYDESNNASRYQQPGLHSKY
jgi:hypothetical protein